MKKRVEKSKPAVAKNGVTRKESPRPVAAASSPHDQLHSLLRGTYARKVCVQRQS